MLLITETDFLLVVSIQSDLPVLLFSSPIVIETRKH